MPCTVLAEQFRGFTRRHAHGEVTLHGLWHTVATALVIEGHLLQAQQRLGHKDASTTLRQYCHALPLHDLDIADRLEALLHASDWAASLASLLDGKCGDARRPLLPRCARESRPRSANGGYVAIRRCGCSGDRP